MTPTEALTLLPFFLTYALIAYLLGRRVGFPLLAGVLLALLLHEWLVRWLTYLFKAPALVVTAASLWKDGALAGLGLVWLQKRLEKRRETGTARLWRRPQALDGLLGLVVAVGVISALSSPNRLAGVAAFRDYYEPILVFIVVGAFYPTGLQLRRFLNTWLLVLAVMAVLGIVQTTFWSAQDYERWWFGSPAGDMGIPSVGLGSVVRLRAPSTVTGPNELGMHMVLGVLLASQLMLAATQRAQWPYLGLAMIFGVALGLTFSRSDLIAGLIGYGMIYWLRRRDRTTVLSRWSLQNLAILAVMAAVVLRTGMFGHMTATVADPQEQYHVQDTSEAIDVLLKNPAGVGMGLVGPRQGAFFPAETAFDVEGSIFQIAFEMGIWGAVLWILFGLLALRLAYRGWKLAEGPLDRALMGTAFAGWLGLAVILVFLPLMQSMPLMSWMWFLLGFAVESGRKTRMVHASSEA